ncbi:MAG TPA: VOC family protein [Candidatus Acidoferrales bacterium]|jgi:catechol 2,3-dioxygenase-like lactoylglutathione lyase family enzyme|nr:VOC family protein [Candidatus Acidoferrales bacterium]
MATSDFKLSKIGYMMLGVKDLANSVAFYRDKLGLDVAQEIPNEFAFLNGGGVMLALAVPLAKHTGQGPGATEVVFAVDDVASAHEALKAKGVQFTVEPRIATGTMWVANFNDPDGHRLAIFGPKK